MFKPLSLFLGLRYTRAKRRTHFISFISFTSILGIALGVAALITVLSVMNGFDKEIKEKLLAMASHISVRQADNEFTDWQRPAAKLKANPHVKGVSPVLKGEGMMVANQVSQYAFVFGILPKWHKNVIKLEDKLLKGHLLTLKPKQFNMIIGEGMAANLGLKVGDKLTLIIPKVNLSIAGALPRLRTFTVSGIFAAGFQYDTHFAYINLNDAQALFKTGKRISSLELRLSDIYKAPAFVGDISKMLGRQYIATDWSWQNKPFFEALKLEKTLMFIMLVLIVAVAAFNILATLVMVVNDKQAEIAILRTLGAAPFTIMKTFMVQGVFIGCFGTLLGIFLGVALALNVTSWVAKIETLLHIKILSPQVYFISYVPSVLSMSDIMLVSAVALLLSFIATLYPAFKASTLQPAEALRYE